jgi:hypothetical protein
MSIVTRTQVHSKLSRPQPDSGPIGVESPLVVVCVKVLRMNRKEAL